MISQPLFRGCWSEEPLESRQHRQTGQKLMRNRGAAEPEVVSGGEVGGLACSGG